MFIQINELRIRLSSIKDYRSCRQTVDTKKWYLELKIQNNYKLIYFDTKQELNKVIKCLDTIFKTINANTFQA